MYRLIAQTNKSIDDVYDAERNRLVASKISSYNKIIQNGIKKMTTMVSKKSTLINKLGKDDYQNRFMETYTNTKKCIKWCKELYTSINKPTAIQQYEALSDTADELKIKAFSDNVSGDVSDDVVDDTTVIDDSEVQDITSVEVTTRKNIAILAFALMFGYFPYSNMSILENINEDLCKMFLRIPALGFLIYPTGYNDYIYWSNKSMTADDWLDYFKNTVLKNKSFYKELVYRFYRIILKSCNDKVATVDANTECKNFINTYSSTLDEYIGKDTDGDETFMKNLMSSINSTCNILGNDYYNRRAKLLPFLALKGVVKKTVDVRFVPTYFPEFNSYNEMLGAVINSINHLITYFCNADVSVSTDTTKTQFLKRYFMPVETGSSFSTELYASVDNWSSTDLRTLNYDATATDFDNDLIVSQSNNIDTTNGIEDPTLDVNYAVFGSTEISWLYHIKYYTAANPLFKELIPQYIKNDSSYNLYSDNNTTYKHFMSEVDYMTSDPDSDPTKSSTDGGALDGVIPFKNLIRVEFINQLFTSELDFPIAPYVGTNFITSWLERMWGNCDTLQKCHPQYMFDKGNVTTDTKNTQDPGVASSYNLNIRAMQGDLEGVQTISKDDLFTKNALLYDENKNDIEFKITCTNSCYRDDTVNITISTNNSFTGDVSLIISKETSAGTTTDSNIAFEFNDSFSVTENHTFDEIGNYILEVYYNDSIQVETRISVISNLTLSISSESPTLNDEITITATMNTNSNVIYNGNVTFYKRKVGTNNQEIIKESELENNSVYCSTSFDDEGNYIITAKYNDLSVESEITVQNQIKELFVELSSKSYNTTDSVIPDVETITCTITPYVYSETSYSGDIKLYYGTYENGNNELDWESFKKNPLSSSQINQISWTEVNVSNSNGKYSTKITPSKVSYCTWIVFYAVVGSVTSKYISAILVPTIKSLDLKLEDDINSTLTSKTAYTAYNFVQDKCGGGNIGLYAFIKTYYKKSKCTVSIKIIYYSEDNTTEKTQTNIVNLASCKTSDEYFVSELTFYESEGTYKIHLQYDDINSDEVEGIMKCNR